VVEVREEPDQVPFIIRGAQLLETARGVADREGVDASTGPGSLSVRIDDEPYDGQTLMAGGLAAAVIAATPFAAQIAIAAAIGEGSSEIALTTRIDMDKVISDAFGVEP
jgi:hypothetical protein